MADQKYKSQADKAAASKKKNNKKSSSSKAEKKGTVTVNSVPTERKIPVRVITSATFLGLFILLLAIFIQPDGIINNILYSVIHGLIGKAGFLISIPALLYLFVIHAFSGKRPIKMRTICVIIFVVACGSIAHLVSDSDMPFNWDAIRSLYQRGNEGSSGGLICGSIAIILDCLVREFLSYLLLVLTALISLLGAMHITITSIIRAIQDRPRPDWEEEKEERQEPAAVVVNHIANKHIERLENKREKQLQKET